MIKFYRHRKTWLAIGLAASGLALGMMLTTTPQDVGPAGVMAWFAITHAALTCLLVAGHSFLRRTTEISWRSLLEKSILSFGIVGVLALRSLNQLQSRDLILLSGLLLLAGLYLRRRQTG